MVFVDRAEKDEGSALPLGLKTVPEIASVKGQPYENL